MNYCSYTSFVSAVNASDLHMGQTFFTCNHFFKQSAWYSCPHSRLPIFSWSLYSSWMSPSRVNTSPKMSKSNKIHKFPLNQYSSLSTWHIMQESVSWSIQAISSRLIDIGDNEYVRIFNWLLIVSSDNPVLTLPILSPSARSSCSEIWMSEITARCLPDFSIFINSNFLDDSNLC